MATVDCDLCGKKVYFAEQQRYDGKVYHGKCLQVAKKKITEAKLIGYYPGAEDRIACQLNNTKTSGPAATAATATAQQASLQQPQAVQREAAPSGANFCSNCGTPRSGNFCSNCGQKF